MLVFSWFKNIAQHMLLFSIGSSLLSYLSAFLKYLKLAFDADLLLYLT